MPNLCSASKTPISSSTHKSVSLHEWWLIEVGDSKLGIGGFTNKETQGMRLLEPASASASVGKGYRCEDEIRVFASAAIRKRLDSNTLEAADGITITISGCINRSHTLSNGFSTEVCDRFLYGFPRNWEEYGSSDEGGKRSLPPSFDDVPVTWVRDMLLSTNEESEACDLTSVIIRDIIEHSTRKETQGNGADPKPRNHIFRRSTRIKRSNKSSEKEGLSFE